MIPECYKNTHCRNEVRAALSERWVFSKSYPQRGKVHRAFRDLVGIPLHSLTDQDYITTKISSPLQDEIKFYFTEETLLGFYFRTSLTQRMNTWMKTGKHGCHDIYLWETKQIFSIIQVTDHFSSGYLLSRESSLP